jgi:hypothetical protein
LFPEENLHRKLGALGWGAAAVRTRAIPGSPDRPSQGARGWRSAGAKSDDQPRVGDRHRAQGNDSSSARGPGIEYQRGGHLWRRGPPIGEPESQSIPGQW